MRNNNSRGDRGQMRALTPDHEPVRALTTPATSRSSWSLRRTWAREAGRGRPRDRPRDAHDAATAGARGHAATRHRCRQQGRGAYGTGHAAAMEPLGALTDRTALARPSTVTWTDDDIDACLFRMFALPRRRRSRPSTASTSTRRDQPDPEAAPAPARAVGGRGGRRAIFAAFGIGKTVIQLETLRLTSSARAAAALIVCPLGVQQEFEHDAAMLGIELHRIRTTDEALALPGGAIAITNYEPVRDGKLDPNVFTVASSTRRRSSARSARRPTRRS
jgi:hypothetical protein